MVDREIEREKERERESEYVLTKLRKCFTIFWGKKCFPTFITVFFGQQKTFLGLIKLHNKKNFLKMFSEKHFTTKQTKPSETL